MSIQTEFESSGGTTFTTRDGEVALYEAVEIASDRMTWEVAGYSVQNRPIHLVKIGQGPVSILFYGLQHATEPAGREAQLALLRDLALTTNPALSAYLDEWTVAFVPTINTDRFLDPTVLNGTANSRLNAQGENINRDHCLTINTPEGQVAVEVRSTLDPRICVDGHEQLSTNREQMQGSHGRNLNLQSDLYDLGRELFHDTIRPAIIDDGWTAGYYPSEAQFEYGRPATSTNSAGINNVLGVLLETRRMVETATDRIAIHRLGYDAVIDWHINNAERIEGVVAASKAFHVANDSPIYLDGSDGLPPSGPHPPTIVLDPPPAGYFVTDAQMSTVGPRLDKFGIAHTPTHGGSVVPLAQEKRAVIAYMLDPESDLKTVSAERVATLAHRRRGASVVGLI